MRTEFPETAAFRADARAYSCVAAAAAALPLFKSREGPIEQRTLAQWGRGRCGMLDGE